MVCLLWDTAGNKNVTGQSFTILNGLKNWQHIGNKFSFDKEIQELENDNYTRNGSANLFSLV